MDFPTYEKMLSGIVEKPDTAASVIADVLNNLKTDFTKMDSLTSQANADAQRIRDLQDTNVKLFMQITGNRKDEAETEEEPLTGEAAVDAFFNKFDKNEEK